MKKNIAVDRFFKRTLSFHRFLKHVFLPDRFFIGVIGFTKLQEFRNNFCFDGATIFKLILRTFLFHRIIYRFFVFFHDYR